ncbi:hypothetical protein [Mycobacterium avium]
MPSTPATPAPSVDPYPYLPVPTGAEWWEWADAGTPQAHRNFHGTRRVIDRRDDPYNAPDIEVYVRGWQHLDGSVDREIVGHELNSDEGLTVAHARQLARALIAAADEAEAAAALEGLDV